MKSIKDSFKNDVNDVELEDDILMKISKSDLKSQKMKLKVKLKLACRSEI
jgi:hypothetical protein